MHIFARQMLIVVAATFLFLNTAMAQVVINEVDYHNELIEIKNLGGTTEDISGWWVCERPNYRQISDLPVTSGDADPTNLSPGEVSAFDVSGANFVWGATGELGLYSLAAFANSDFIESYVQWGAAFTGGDGRADTAEAGGVWADANAFVAAVVVGHSLEYTGTGNSVASWFDQETPTIGDENTLPVEMSLFTGRSTADGIQLIWKTETETNNLGFNVYRSESADGEYVKVNPRIIPGVGTGTGRQYKWMDENTELTKAYYYVIEDIAFDGATERSDPIRVSRVTPTAKKSLVTTWARIKRTK